MKKLLIVILVLIFSKSGFCGDVYIKKWEELPKHGLLPPETYDIKSAKKLIVMAIQATAFFKGDWWQAHGLLGATRLPRKPNEALFTSLGYIQLFKTALTGNTHTKMESAAEWGETGLVVLYPQPCKSWIYQREHFIGLIGYELNHRFTYNKVGNYGRILSPASDHRSTVALKGILKDAYSLYKQLNEKGFNDETLGDAIGIANAILQYDGVSVNYGGILGLPFAEQIYMDTVTAMIENMKEGAEFFYALNNGMVIRGLNYDDVIAIPKSQEQLNAIVRLVKEDLDNLEKIIEVSPEKKSGKNWLGNIQEKVKKTIEVWKK